LTWASGKKAIFLKKWNLEISNWTIYSNNQAINVCTTNSWINQTNYTNLKIDINANIIWSWAVILREAKYSQDSSVNCWWVWNEWYGAKLDIKWTLEWNLWIIWNIESWNSIIDFYGNLISNGAWIAENGAAIVNVYEWASIKAGEYSAIEQRAWTLNVYWWIFESTATSYSCEWTGNGVTTKWAGIAIAQHTTQLPMTTNISWWVFSGVYGISIKNPQWVAQPSPTVNITSWDFRWSTSGITLNDSGYNTKIEKFISWWTFSSSVAEEYCADGYIPNNNGDWTFGVKVGEYVAQIWTTKYETLSWAIAAVITSSETTIKLLTGTLTNTLVFGWKNIKLDLNGNILTWSFKLNSWNLTIDNWTLIWNINMYTNDNSSDTWDYNQLTIWSWATIKSTYAIILREKGNKGYGSKIDVNWTLSGMLWVMWNITEWNSEININWTIKDWIHLNGNVTVNVYDPANIESSEAALEVRAWTANIYWWNFKTNSTGFSFQPNGNGSSTEWVALAVAQHTTVLPITVNVYSWSFDWNGNASLALLDPQSNNDAENMHISIEWGNFKNGVVISNQTSCTDINNCLNGDNYYVKNFISSWNFSKPVNPDHCADGFIPKDNGGWNYGVTPGYKVTFINEWSEYTWLYIETNGTIAENLVIDPSKTWYTFTWWYDAEIGWNKWIFGTTWRPVIASGTLYAIYEANKYNVNFNSWGADWWIDMSAQTLTYDVELLLNQNTYTKEWYQFVQWTGTTLSGNTFADKANVINLSTWEDITLYAEWSANWYTIAYNNNGWEWSIADSVATYDADIDLSNWSGLSKSWYHFTGWAITSDWTVAYTWWETVKNLTWTKDAIVTLYAVWEANTDTPYIVEHYLQNTWDNNYTLVIADTDNLSWTTNQSTVAVTKDYTWFTLSWDITEYQTAIAWDESTVVKLYYNRNPHTLKFVVDWVETTWTVVYGADITAPADPTKDSCNSFAWWTSSVDGLTTTGTMPNSDVTFTATWNYICSKSSGWGGGGSSRPSNNMQEVVLGWEVEVNTWDEAEINTGDENKLDENNDNDEDDGWIGDTQGYDPELVEAYKWAYKNGITTMPTIEEARLKDNITRAELAKMMVVFMSEVLHRQPVITETFDYPDVNEKALWDLTGYIQLAYQYQIMGIQADGKPLNKFNPRGKVSRAEFATVLSRVLYGSVNNQKWSNYREKHIEALNKAGILTNTDPKIQELRWWIILMLYRSQNSETNNVEENTAQVTTGDLSEVESGSAAEVATWTTAEVATGEVVEAATGATAETAIAEANTWDVAKVESGSTAEVATWDSK